jgi:hypothetical protein
MVSSGRRLREGVRLSAATHLRTHGARDISHRPGGLPELMTDTTLFSSDTHRRQPTTAEANNVHSWLCPRADTPDADVETPRYHQRRSGPRAEHHAAESLSGIGRLHVCTTTGARVVRLREGGGGSGNIGRCVGGGEGGRGGGGGGGGGKLVGWFRSTCQAHIGLNCTPVHCARPSDRGSLTRSRYRAP